MLTELVRRLLAAAALFLLQLLVFSHIHLWGYATPLVGVAFILYLPSNASRVVSLVAAFLLGLGMDMISSSPGVGAASMTLLAMLQPTLLTLMATREGGEAILTGFRHMGTAAYTRYVAVVVALFVAVYFLLDVFSFAHILDFLLTLLSSYVLTLAVVLAMEKVRDKTH